MDNATSSPLEISSPAFPNNTLIPREYSCDGDNISPPLDIHNVDPRAMSLALIVDDPDAMGGTWTHWVVFNIPPDTRAIERAKAPLGLQGTGSGNKLGYEGPCPPSRTHHYHFKLYSLDTILDLPQGASKEQVISAMTGHVLQEAELIGLYSMGS